MLTVHHLGISQSDRVVWLCEELGIAYELVRYDRENGLAPPAYRALTPFGTSPVITDDDLVLGESGAIVEYIIATYGEGRLSVRPGEPGYAGYLFWFHFANGSLMPSAMIDMVIAQVEQQNPIFEALRDRLNRAYAQIESRLGEVPYLAGDALTAADIMTVFPLTTMRAFTPRSLADSPNTSAYLKRIAARPAFRTAMAKADPGFTVPID